MQNLRVTEIFAYVRT